LDAVGRKSGRAGILDAAFRRRVLSNRAALGLVLQGRSVWRGYPGFSTQRQLEHDQAVGLQEVVIPPRPVSSPRMRRSDADHSAYRESAL